MEKIGLFDLIDKFNTVATGKKDFDKQQVKAQKPLEKNGASTKFCDPQILPPPQYMMNAKMIDFCKKHDDFAKSVKAP